MENVLEVKNLTKKFGSSVDGFIAVNDISFSLKDGEILGVLGPNGAGKTTTIQMLLGIMEPSHGTIAYFGKEFIKNREEILKQINFSSTYINLPWWCTVSEILDLFCRLYGVKDRQKRIKRLATEFELDGLLSKQYSMLSAGERTRVLLTKAFLNYPKLLLLDEPTASLDIDIAVRVREFLKKQQKEYGVSMLLTSHNMSEVEEMCDRVIVINKGTIIATDTPENLAKSISSSYVELLISRDHKKAEEFFTKIDLPFEKNKHRFTLPIDEHKVAELLMLLASEKIEYEEIGIEKPDLEDYFLELIEKTKI